jgi:D-alanyl-D-alanine carboxypeptidase
MATAVLQQVQAGTLKLTDTVKNLDPRLAKKYPSIRQITVTQLLSMTSGIPDYADAAVMIMAKDPQHRFTRDQLIALGMSSGKQKPPGSGGYSTTNYLILGHILRSLIPRSPEALVNGVFRQAGMKQSRLPLTTRPLPDPAAHGYVGVLWASQLGDTNPSLTPTSDVSTWAFEWGKEGGGAWSTIGDLATWGGTCLGNSLLPRPIIAERLRTTKIDAGHGLGIIRQGDWLAHGGQAIGYETNVACNPKTGAVVATAVNSTYGKVDVDSAIGKAAYPEYLAAVSSP